MSAAVLVFMTFVTAGALVLVGWSLHGLVLEIRHDCMPHDPYRCKGVIGGGQWAPGGTAARVEGPARSKMDGDR